MILYCKKILGGVRNSSPAVAGLPFGSANKRICGSLRSPKLLSVASHIRKTLNEMPAVALERFKTLEYNKIVGGKK